MEIKIMGSLVIYKYFYFEFVFLYKLEFIFVLKLILNCEDGIILEYVIEL